MLQQRPVLSQIHNIKGLEPDLPVRELSPRNNTKSQNSNKNDYDFQQAMAATRQQMDRHLEAKREARLQVAERQEQAAQAQRAQDDRAKQDARTQQERALEPKRVENTAKREDPRDEDVSRNQRQDVSRRDLDTQTDRAQREPAEKNDGETAKPELTSDKKEAFSTLDSKQKTKEKIASDQVEQGETKQNGVVDSSLKGEILKDSDAPVSKALSELEALLNSLLNGEQTASSKFKTEQVLQSLAALMKGESLVQSPSDTATDIDQQMAQLLNNLASLLGSSDGPSIDPLSQLVNNIDLNTVLEDLTAQLNNLQSLDLSQLSEQQLAVFEQLQEQLKLLSQKLSNFVEQPNTEPSNESPDSEESTLSWLNDVVLKLKNESEKSHSDLTSASVTEKVTSAESLLEFANIKATREQSTENGTATIRPDVLNGTKNNTNASESVTGASDKNTPLNFANNIANNQGNGSAKSDGNAAMAQQVIAALNNTESSAQTKPPITAPIQLQAAANGQSTNANVVAQGVVSAELEQQVSQSEKLNDFKLSELQRLMTDTGTSKSSQLKSLIESGVLGEAVNTDKPTTYNKPSVVEVAGVQLDKTLQAPKLESITQTKTDAVIKENILFNKQALASNIQAQVGMMLARNMKSVDIRLDPPELGSMQIKLSMGEQANVSFVVSSQQAKDALEESLPRLKELLEQHGMQLGDSDVRKDNDSGQADEQENEQGSLNTAGANELGEDDNNDEAQAVEVKVKSPWQVDDYA